MNPIDDQLNRLFRAAAQVRPESVAPAPFGLETRALAAWRESMADERNFWDMGLLVRGLIVAGAIMFISFVPAWNTSTSPFSDFLQLTDTTVSSGVTP